MAAFSSSLSICFLYVALTLTISIDAKNSTFGLHQVLKNGQTLISPNERFELGFFNVSPSGDLNRVAWYLGIWYRGIKPLTVVWIANRQKPLRGNGLELRMNPGGDILLHDDEGNAVSFARLKQPVFSPSLVLQNSGNLVIKHGNNWTDERYVWQSFDFPTDTLLPAMKLGWDLKSNTNRVLTSWRTLDDPSAGDFVFGIKSPFSPQLVLEKNGLVQSRWGPWTGERFSGSNIVSNLVFRIVYHYSDDEIYFMFEMVDDSVLLRLEVSSIVRFLKWDKDSRVWVPMVTLTKDICDEYGACGPYSTCNADDPVCRCLEGFVFNSPRNLCRFNRSDGCRRQNALDCSKGDGFVKYQGIKLPDNFTVMKGLNFVQCRDLCLRNCTCRAYTSIRIYGQRRECVAWFDQLIDIRVSTRFGDEVYIRMARVELDSTSHTKIKKITAITGGFVASVLLGAAMCWARNKFRSLLKNPDKQDDNRIQGLVTDVPVGDLQVELFNMCTISAATGCFSLDNKIGQGGFGLVYKGQLQDGQKIAVKRLSETSNQGLQEFKNEVNLIAELQHRNLVKLLGCCIEGEERMLIYEYMQNKSLDKFIFDPVRKSLLLWGKRFSIIKGVAKGLDYLHSGSSLRVVHRDLKASNILLDECLNPKISDFGLARKSENEREETTRTVMGTLGYMSPEYVIDGHYSTRSDVFSFGVLAMEIITGERNWGFHHPDHDFNLLGHAWKLYNEGRDIELIDTVLKESVTENEVSRSIKIGLLCAQHSKEERPTMSQVVSMLENESVRLAEPQEPGFFTRRSAAGFTSAAEICFSVGWMLDVDQDSSVNGLAVTEL